MFFEKTNIIFIKGLKLCRKIWNNKGRDQNNAKNVNKNRLTITIYWVIKVFLFPFVISHFVGNLNVVLLFLDTRDVIFA